jgi:hypothetical protein
MGVRRTVLGVSRGIGWGVGRREEMDACWDYVWMDGWMGLF